MPPPAHVDVCGVGGEGAIHLAVVQGFGGLALAFGTHPQRAAAAVVLLAGVAFDHAVEAQAGVCAGVLADADVGVVMAGDTGEGMDKASPNGTVFR